MAVKDSPLTTIKAKDAKNAMFEAPKVSNEFLVELLTRLDLQAVAVFNINDGYVETSVHAQDTDSRDVLHDWSTFQARAFPSTIANMRGALILSIRKEGQIETATWGQTEAMCRAIGTYSTELLEGISACPFQTWFGWGNEGIPKKLSESELKTLPAHHVDYVNRYTHASAV